MNICLKHSFTPILTFIVGLSSTLVLNAQKTLKDSTLNLQEVEIVSTRLSSSETKSPMAISVIDKFRLQTATQQLSPYESLGAIPGVFAMNPDNFSQDLRISIRGFGARAAFGIRGIRMFVDGLPEGTPDGQVDVDNIDMGVIRQMEVIRGAASGLYGNAAGGVIYMLTENPTSKKPLLEAQFSAGSFGFKRYQFKIGQKINKFLYFFNASSNQTNGYRDWSQMQNSILNAKMIYEFNSNTKLSVLANYGNSPTANDPGGLTLQQIEANPQQAGANNLLFETGESVTQGRIGMTFDTKVTDKHSFGARAFYTSRQLLNRLAVATNGFGDLKRNYYGMALNYQLNEKIGKMNYRLKIGIDIENQSDIRQRYSYLKTTFDGQTKYVQDKLALNQIEAFKSTGVYLLQDLQPTSKLLISFGLRYDALRLNATDQFLTDGDQSGEKNFSKINPMAGVSYLIKENTSIYANYSTSYESPTLNELSNNPDNKGGFNLNLNPQQASSVEIGSKGFLGKKLKYDVAIFNINTQNDLVPYQITGQTGKTFYRNAGKTVRKGIEIGLSYQIAKGLNAYITQTISDFKYENYSVNTTIYDGKVMPGVPKSHSQLELRYFNSKGFFLIAQNRNASIIFANDNNTFETNPYSILNFRAGYVISFKTVQAEPFIGINNILNSNYIANVQINAQSERYFEPAAKRYFFGGIKIRLL